MAKAKRKPHVSGEVELVELATVRPNGWNPNECDAHTLASIERGFTEEGWLKSHALTIWRTDEKGVEKRLIIDGEHRWEGYTATTTRRDGSPSKQTRVRDPETGKALQVQSSVVGFFDRQGGRFPFCRATAFTADDLVRWKVLEELAQVGARLLHAEQPVRYQAQLEHARKANPAWIIAGTPFSTLTVNRNVLGAVHKDSGDFEPGFGVLTVCRRGTYRGAYLGFPEFFCGVDMRDGDAILFDPHAWHAVTDFEDKGDDAERISVVYYLRSRIDQCQTPELELQRAQAAR
jgi:hypothetical protein